MKEFPMFKSIGKNVSIDKSVRFFNADTISIGDNVRIDANCIISGGMGIRIGSHIHIATNVSLFGGSCIIMEDFTNIAAYSLILSESDDFSGKSLIGPQIPRKFKPKYHSGKPILLKKHTIVGARSTILPGVTCCDGVVIGAHSLVKDDCLPWCIYVGSPARLIGSRSKEILQLEKEFLRDWEDCNGQ